MSRNCLIATAVFAFTFTNLSWACITPDVPLMLGGEPPAGLEQVAINGDSTLFTAGNGKNAVNYTVSPKFPSSGSENFLEDYEKMEICIFAQNLCAKPTRICIKKSALRDSIALNKQIAKSAVDCPRLKDVINLGDNGTLEILAQDKQGKNFSNVTLMPVRNADDDNRFKAKKDAAAKKRNRLQTYALNFAPSRAGRGAADRNQIFMIQMATSTYKVNDSEKPLQGENLVPVEFAADPASSSFDLLTFNTATIASKEFKGTHVVSNVVETSSKNYETARGLGGLFGEEEENAYSGFNVGTPALPVLVSDCKITGGTPRHSANSSNQYGDTKMISPAGVKSGQ